MHIVQMLEKASGKSRGKTVRLFFNLVRRYLGENFCEKGLYSFGVQLKISHYENVKLLHQDKQKDNIASSLKKMWRRSPPGHLRERLKERPPRQSQKKIPHWKRARGVAQDEEGPITVAPIQLSPLCGLSFLIQTWNSLGPSVSEVLPASRSTGSQLCSRADSACPPDFFSPQF